MNGQKDVNTLLAMTTSSRCCPVCEESTSSSRCPLVPTSSARLSISLAPIHCCCHCFILLFSFSALGSLLLFMKWQEQVALLIIECYFYFSRLRVAISIRSAKERMSFLGSSFTSLEAFSFLFSLHSTKSFHSCKLCFRPLRSRMGSGEEFFLGW